MAPRPRCTSDARRGWQARRGSRCSARAGGAPSAACAKEALTLSAVYCGRHFTDPEVDHIRDLARTLPTREAIARAVCTDLDWRKPDGGLKDMSCKVVLLRMHRDGLIPLPPPRHGYSPAAHTPTPAARALPFGPPLQGTRGDISRLTLDPVQGPADSRHWNELVACYHYLGYAPLPGAQLRYFIHGDGAVLGVLGFGAAAWKIAPRDEFVGWTPEQRRARLHLVVNNARFLLLPWVSIRGLASSVLALAARRLPTDWRARYAYEPVLLESFVERARFSGTSYRAANWIHVGQTQGRGKLDRYNLYAKPVKDIYLYPLHRRFRTILAGPLPAPPPTHQTE